ncbi:MAG: VTT domain-containing protein, partial [Cytophagales bacterium]|nr:VTT domain-containing protein [Cytophagales bacterium]
MKTGTIIRLGIVAILVALGVFLFVRYDVQTELVRILTWIDDQGIVGVIVYIAVYIIATVLFIPGSVITLGAGFIYGVVYGSIYVSIGSTIGAFFAFLVGRYLARGWIERRVAGNKQ